MCVSSRSIAPGGIITTTAWTECVAEKASRELKALGAAAAASALALLACDEVADGCVLRLHSTSAEARVAVKQEDLLHELPDDVVG